MTKEQILAKEIIQEAWDKGDLFYKLQDHQIEVYNFLRSRTRLTCVLLLSRRFGKTHVSFIVDVEDCLRKPGARIAYFYPTLKQGKQIIHPIADIVFQDAPKSAIWSEMNSCYEFPNGSQIFVFGCDTIRDIDRHRGPKYSSIRIDEAGVHNYLNYLYKSVLLPTLLTMTEKPLIAFMGTPSPSIDHEFRNIYEQTFVSGDAIKKTLDDNTSIDLVTKEEFIKESGGRESTETLREYYCEWVTDASLAVVPEWKEEYIQEIERSEFFQFYEIHAGMDIGGRDKTAIIWGYYDFKKGCLVIEYESILTGSQTTVETIAQAVRETELSYYDKKIRRWSDNNAVILLQDLLQNYNVPFIATSKDLKQAMVSELRIMVNAGRVLIHPRCIELIGCLRSAVWDKTRTSFQRSSIYGHFDALDALIYLVRNIDTNTNPIPYNYGLDIRNMHGVERLRQQSSYNSLKRAFKK